MSSAPYILPKFLSELTKCGVAGGENGGLGGISVTILNEAYVQKVHEEEFEVFPRL